jgi:hypothetical protein|tara:strand:- start:47 stop:271 length:225 start_codon:yes stop_codon:yes gene_type:complete
MRNDIIQLGDRLFVSYRTIKITPKIEENISILKKLWHCDTALKKEGVFYLCNEIKEIEFEEIKEDENKLCDTSL